MAPAQIVADGKAIVYIYSFDVSALGNVRKIVSLDGKPLANVRPERYFIAVIEPGKHAIHWQDKKHGGIEMDFVAGMTYYLRAGWNEGGFMIKPKGLDLVAPENGAFDVKQMRAVDAGDLKDKLRATVAIAK